MDFPIYYLTIKPIFDLSLFGIEDVEGHFSINETLVFSQKFLSYQEEFLTYEDHVDHEILLQTCYHHLLIINKDARKSVVNLILENEPLSEALIMTSMLSDGLINPELGSIKYLVGLRTYIEEKKISESMILFFQQHFLNFERIKPTNYKNFELSRPEYLRLVSDYLQIQSQVF